MIDFRFLINKFLSLIYYNRLIILVLSHSFFKGGFFNVYLLLPNPLNAAKIASSELNVYLPLE